MKDRKIRIRSSAYTKRRSKDIHERLDAIDKDMDLKLLTLSCIFLGTEGYPEQFHELYVKPLLDEGLTLENSLDMLVDGVLLPN